MNAFGILDKDIASLKITKGFKVILYENDNFGGASLEVTADTICLGDWKDRASSLKITTTGVTNLDGTYFLQNAASNLFMTINGGYSNVADGANIMQFSKISNTSQQFKFTHLGDGIYKIFAVHSDKSMDVDNGSKSNGANVQQWTYYGFPSQQFIVSPADSGNYLLIALHSGKIIESITDFHKCKRTSVCEHKPEKRTVETGACSCSAKRNRYWFRCSILQWNEL